MSGSNTHKLIFDGFGGQGVISAGKFLATAAVNAGLECAFTPSYGAEVRGGNAHCDIIITSGQVLSPRIETPTAMLLFCVEAYDRFASLAADGCDLIVNSSLIDTSSYTGSARLVKVDAAAVAAEAKNLKAINMAMVGAWLGVAGCISEEVASQTVRKISPPHLQQYVDSNIAAMEIARRNVQA